MYKIQYTQTAELDLDSIFNYIAADSRERAVNYLGKIGQSISQLKDYPELGYLGKYPELQVLGIRVLPFESYLTFYTVDEAEKIVNVLRVLRGTMNYRKLF